LRLRSDNDAIMLEINYSDKNPWPAGAEASGHSLVLARPSYGENFPEAWDVSERIGGSPGAPDPLKIITGCVTSLSTNSWRTQMIRNSISSNSTTTAISRLICPAAS
jgi:hypothetical protein